MKNKILAALKQLYIQNNGKGQGFRAAEAADGKSVDLFVYEPIGWYGVEASDFVKEVKDAGTRPINMHINSPGGDVFEARAMMTAIQSHEAPVTAYIDGIAASAATGIALAAGEVVIAPGAYFMIHNAWGFCVGDAAEMTATADLLSKINGTIADDYVAKSGMDKQVVLDLMSDETWYTGSEAVEIGLADRLSESNSGGDGDASAMWNLSAYHNAPKELTDPPQRKQYNRAEIERRFALLEKTAP